MTDASLDLARLDMLRRQLRERGISDARVLAAMGKVPRERFVPASLRNEAYADRALGIECGQSISQPYIVALMTQALELRGDEKVLEVGTGSGYQTAILAECAREVLSIERHADLSRVAGERLAGLGYRNVSLQLGDGSLGCAAQAPFDRIMVTAAALHCPPALLGQLADDGILVIPLGSQESQTLQAIQRHQGGLRRRRLTGCRFVPLVGQQGWPD
jgi:protein-L-isoaspartate(D-aspartate) O-methyltransferase